MENVLETLDKVSDDKPLTRALLARLLEDEAKKDWLFEMVSPENRVRLLEGVSIN